MYTYTQAMKFLYPEDCTVENIFFYYVRKKIQARTPTAYHSLETHIRHIICGIYAVRIRYKTPLRWPISGNPLANEVFPEVLWRVCREWCGVRFRRYVGPRIYLHTHAYTNSVHTHTHTHAYPNRTLVSGGMWGRGGVAPHYAYILTQICIYI